MLTLFRKAMRLNLRMTPECTDVASGFCIYDTFRHSDKFVPLYYMIG